MCANAMLMSIVVGLTCGFDMRGTTIYVPSTSHALEEGSALYRRFGVFLRAKLGCEDSGAPMCDHVP